MELRWGYLLAYTVAVPVYMMLTVLAPNEAAAARYHLSETAIFFLQATIILPIILIWLAGLRGISALRDYCKRLTIPKLGEPMKKIVQGLSIIVLGLVVTSLYGAARPYALSGHIVPYQIFYEYLNLLFPLLGIARIFAGSRELLRRNRVPAPSRTRIIVLTALTVAVFAGICLLLFQNPYRQHTPDPQTYQSYYMSDPLIFLTILVPYLATWLLGGLAALNLRRYRRSLPEGPFRWGIGRLTNGIISIIGISVLVLFIMALSTSLTELSIGVLLGIVYVLLALYGVGYLFISSAARKLQGIEMPTPERARRLKTVPTSN